MTTLQRWVTKTIGILLSLSLAFAGACRRSEPAIGTASVAQGGNAAEGKRLVGKYACNSCHVIPGIEGPKGSLGPSLEHLATRPTVGGKLANTPENLARWLQNPQAIDPDNSMPNLGILPQESRDLAAFLSTLR